MRPFLLLSVIVVTGVLSAPAPHQGGSGKNAMDDIIVVALEQVRTVIRDGLPSAGIPPLDPFHIEQLKVDMNASSAVIHLEVGDTDVTHLSEFIIESVVTNLLQFKMSLELRQEVFRIDGNYFLDGLILSLFPLYGQGDYYIEVTNATIGGGAKLDLMRPGIEDLFLNFSFESIEVHFENLLGGGSMQSAVETTINLLGKQVVDAVWSLINEPLCQIIEEVVNNALAP